MYVMFTYKTGLFLDMDVNKYSSLMDHLGYYPWSPWHTNHFWIRVNFSGAHIRKLVESNHGETADLGSQGHKSNSPQRFPIIPWWIMILPFWCFWAAMAGPIMVCTLRSRGPPKRWPKFTTKGSSSREMSLGGNRMMQIFRNLISYMSIIYHIFIYIYMNIYIYI